MNGKSVSLPDLVAEKKRNTCLSLSEGFAGATHEGSLAATTQNWCPRPGQGAPLVGQREAGEELQRVLPIYYRTRQMAFATEKENHRMPMKLQNEMRGLEKTLARELRPVHPLFFQRFDDLQLDRLVRAMPFLRLSSGRWLFGSDTLGAQWPETSGSRAFLLLKGQIALYSDPDGAGERTDIYVGGIFGDRRFWLCDESMRDCNGGAAHCEEPCIVGIITSNALEAAYSDRAFGNARIAQSWKNVPSMRTICKGDEGFVPRASIAGSMKEMIANPDADLGDSGAVVGGLRDLSKVATALHIATGQEVLSSEPLEDCVLVVAKGALEVRGDIILTERLDALPPKKVRIRVYLDRAEKLAGDSIFDKLDPYCLVKLSESKKFQTPVMWNVGPHPKFDYKGVLTYKDEENLEITVMDFDKYSADDLCGTGSIPCSELHDGFKGCVQLFRPKRGIFSSEDSLEEPAGKVFIRVTWDYEKVSALTKTAKSKFWKDQELFMLPEKACWGHEHVMLQHLFMRTLEQAANNMPYTLKLENIRITGCGQKGGNPIVSCWKASRKRFMDFVKHTGREKQFLQACRVSSLEKQAHVKSIIKRLIRKWQIEEESTNIRKGMQDPLADVEEAIDPSRFRIAYRNYKAHVSVRCALNLTGGSLFDKLDPYAVLKFRNSRQAPFRTSVLSDAGADPVWECDGEMLYNGEVALEISVWDYEKYNADVLIGTGTVTVEQFAPGFEGMVPLALPGNRKKKSMKQMLITIGIQWPPLEQNAAGTSTFGASLTGGQNFARTFA